MVTKVTLTSADKVIIAVLILLIIGAVFLIRGFFKEGKKKK